MEKEFKVVWLEVKSPDWKIVTLADDTQQYGDVSINRVNKKGEAFPDFDGIINAGTIKGNLWTSSAGKRYLFAPDANKTPSGAYTKPQGGFKAGMQKMVEEKNANIQKSQENKNEGIKIASTISMAVNIVIATLKEEKIIDEAVIKGKIREWREYFLAEWDNVNNAPPFN